MSVKHGPLRGCKTDQQAFVGNDTNVYSVQFGACRDTMQISEWYIEFLNKQKKE